MSNYTVALSGLQNTSLAIDTVSNNIANANTVGYKAGEYVFADQFVKAINPADQARVGMGTQSLGVRRPMLQGTITNSANPLDLAISGKGMFRLLQGSGTSGSVDPSAVYYSRNGQFNVDKEGYIVNENGMYLTGYQPSLDGNEISDDLIKNHGLLRMPDSNLPGNQTTSSHISALLDSKTQAFTKTANVAFDPTQATYNNKTSQTVFDNEGNSHTLEVYYRRITDGFLSIESKTDGTGYTYKPGPSSSPNTLNQSLVTLNKESVLRVDSPSKAAALSKVGGKGVTSFTLDTTGPKFASDPVDVTGMKIFINGIDSGAVVKNTFNPSSPLTIEVATGTIDVPTGAAVTFYDPDIPLTLATAPTPTATKTLTLPSIANLKIGDKLYLGGIDTGATITAINNLTSQVTLSTEVNSASTAAVFKHALNMTLITPDGTEIGVQGASNRKSSGEFLTSNMARVEVYASLDNKFYDHDDGTFSDRKITPEVPGLIGGYKAVSQLNFVGGRNIDSLVTDPISGNPTFSTTTKLTTTVTNAAGGNSALVFDLDLSDTTLQPGAFQITHSIQNGEPLARLTNVTVDNQGRIVGVYGSGKQQFVGQVALVHFDNSEGLIPVGKNAFAASVQSGTEHSAEGVLVGRAGTGIFGEIKGQALESSNVDLANELVRLMVLQRSYSANSQSMKAFDQTLRDTLQMVS
jgi:flagellar hook protein FlgE